MRKHPCGLLTLVLRNVTIKFPHRVKHFPDFEGKVVDNDRLGCYYYQAVA